MPRQMECASGTIMSHDRISIILQGHLCQNLIAQILQHRQQPVIGIGMKYDDV